MRARSATVFMSVFGRLRGGQGRRNPEGMPLPCGPPLRPPRRSVEPVHGVRPPQCRRDQGDAASPGAVRSRQYRHRFRYSCEEPWQRHRSEPRGDVKPEFRSNRRQRRRRRHRRVGTDVFSPPGHFRERGRKPLEARPGREVVRLARLALDGQEGARAHRRPPASGGPVTVGLRWAMRSWSITCP